jgi:hypothetical protein
MNKNPPKYLMAFNEPDVDSQANMDPYYAADLYMQQINPWASKGTKLGSPAIVWNLDWMNTFLSQVQSKQGRVDFICLHWFVSLFESRVVTDVYANTGTVLGPTSQVSRTTSKPLTNASTRTSGSRN